MNNFLKITKMIKECKELIKIFKTSLTIEQTINSCQNNFQVMIIDYARNIPSNVVEYHRYDMDSEEDNNCIEKYINRQRFVKVFDTIDRLRKGLVHLRNHFIENEDSVRQVCNALVVERLSLERCQGRAFLAKCYFDFDPSWLEMDTIDYDPEGKNIYFTAEYVTENKNTFLALECYMMLRNFINDEVSSIDETIQAMEIMSFKDNGK